MGKEPQEVLLRGVTRVGFPTGALGLSPSVLTSGCDSGPHSCPLENGAGDSSHRLGWCEEEGLSRGGVRPRGLCVIEM